MMNFIWGGLLLTGIFFAFIGNNLSSMTDGILQSCTEAIYFMINIAGIIAVWSGMMCIANRIGLIDRAAKLSMPLIRFLFPGEKNKEIIAMMLMSFTANIFGAGNSATVFSLRAMEMLDAENNHSIYASNAMCMFTAVSMSMLQLVPITVIKIRSDLGSADPGNIIVPSMLAGLVSMVASIAVCKFYENRSKFK